MPRLLERVAALAIGLAVVGTPLAPAAGVYADDDNTTEDPAGANQDLFSPDVEGIVYQIADFSEGRNAGKVVTILNNDLGLTLELFITDSKLVSLVNNKTLCTNRFVRATGLRTSPKTLDVQGLDVDLGRPCGTPPK